MPACCPNAGAERTYATRAGWFPKLVWRKAAFVAAVVVARGRIVATWAHGKRARRLDVEVTPLGLWRKTRHAAATRREACAVAKHLGLETAGVEIAS